ncbi:MAG TPA: hypothetical protein VMV18_03465, partial [bacterium]|nr:hypothetical protein [bacterium]
NAPHESRSWFPLLPTNQRALIDKGRWASLVTQVRLEAQPDPVPAAILEPVVETEQQSALEPVPRDRAAAAVEQWEPGAKSVLPLHGPAAFDVGRAGPGRPEITFVAPTTDLGRKVDLSVDGRAVSSWLLGTARGSWALPPMEKGRHLFEIQTSAKGLQLYLDQAPLYDGATVLKARTVHALLSRPLTFKVLKYTKAPVTMGLVVYAPKIEPNARPGLRVRIDHGAPRVYALPTADIPSSTRLASLQGREAGFPRPYPIVLGGDLAPGPHTVDVDSVQPTPVWVRAFVVDPSAPAQEKARQSFLLEPVNVSGPSDE